MCFGFHHDLYLFFSFYWCSIFNEVVFSILLIPAEKISVQHGFIYLCFYVADVAQMMLTLGAAQSVPKPTRVPVMPSYQKPSFSFRTMFLKSSILDVSSI